MSNIPKARAFVRQAMMLCTDHRVNRKLAKALALMTRSKYVRHAYPKSDCITAKQKRKVRRLSLDLNLTQTDIARLAGLRNAGRVSEILNGRR